MISIRQNFFRNLPKAFILALTVLSHCFAFAMQEIRSNNGRPLPSIYDLGIPGFDVKDKPESCRICLEDFPIKDLQSLGCKHKFCKECLLEFVKGKTRERHFPHPCPLCRRGFTDADMENILEKHIFEIWDYIRSFDIMKRDDNFFACRTPDCNNGLLYSQEDSQIWKCDKCLYQYCLRCKEEGHTGSCADYDMYLRSNNLKGLSVKRLFELGKIKRCPRCRIFTHRVNNKCDIICERCSTSWCWHCIKLRGLCKCRRRRLRLLTGKKRKRPEDDETEEKSTKKRKLND